MDSLRSINPGLFIVWNEILERFQLFYRDSRNGLTRIIKTIEDDDGNYIPLDNRTIEWARDIVCWDLLNKFPSPKDMYEEMQRRKEKRKQALDNEHREYRKEWNRAHRKYWKAALENIKRGILTLPEEKKIKTISIPGIRPGSGTVILPKGFYEE